MHLHMVTNTGVCHIIDPDTGEQVATGHLEVDDISLDAGTRISGVTVVIDAMNVPTMTPIEERTQA